MPQRNYNGDTMRTITKAELLEALEELNDDDKIIFTTDFGDHHHTPQALPLRGEVEEVRITKSAYSNSGFALEEEDDDEEDCDERQTYFVIR